MTLSASTLSGNGARGGTGDGSLFSNGGAFGGAIFDANGTVEIRDSTRTANLLMVEELSFFGAPGGGGVFSLADDSSFSQTGDDRTATLLIFNSIVANTVGGEDLDNGVEGRGVFQVAGIGNIVESSGTSLPTGFVLSSDDPQLGPLQNDGGPTFTHALLPGSPALDAVPNSFRETVAAAAPVARYSFEDSDQAADGARSNNGTYNGGVAFGQNPLIHDRWCE